MRAQPVRPPRLHANRAVRGRLRPSRTQARTSPALRSPNVTRGTRPKRTGHGSRNEAAPRGKARRDCAPDRAIRLPRSALLPRDTGRDAPGRKWPAAACRSCARPDSASIAPAARLAARTGPKEEGATCLSLWVHCLPTRSNQMAGRRRDEAAGGGALCRPAWSGVAASPGHSARVVRAQMDIYGNAFGLLEQALFVAALALSSSIVGPRTTPPVPDTRKSQSHYRMDLDCATSRGPHQTATPLGTAPDIR